MPITIKQLPETERPYEKLELYGEKTLSDAELLAIIIKTGTKEETSVQLAQKVLALNEEKQEGLRFLKNITIEELTQIKGIGKIKAIQIKAIGELTTRMTRPSNYKKIKINSPKDMAKLVMEELRTKKREVVKLVALNTRREIMKIKDISTGGKSSVEITVSEVLAEAIKMQTNKIILIHNHPSGDSEPSQADLDYTAKLYDTGELIGIELVDHIVIGNGVFTSIYSSSFQHKRQQN